MENESYSFYTDEGKRNTVKKVLYDLKVMEKDFDFEIDEESEEIVKREMKGITETGKKQGFSFVGKNAAGLCVEVRKPNQEGWTNVKFSGDGDKYLKVGAAYRKMDMLNNTVEVEVINQGEKVSYKELNLDQSVIGSDETGNGETFKKIIVVAVYIDSAHMDYFLEWNITDSKWMTNRIEEVGRELVSTESSKINSYQDFIENGGEQEKLIKRGKKNEYTTTISGVIEKENLAFCVGMVSNAEYNKATEDGNGINKNQLLKDIHRDVIQKLIEAKGQSKSCYIVVDDFYSEGEKNKDGKRMQFVKELDYPKIVTVIKADRNVMAAACASVISTYIQNLYLRDLKENLENNYGLVNVDIPKGNQKKDIENFLDRLDELGKKQEFLNEYAKKKSLD